MSIENNIKKEVANLRRLAETELTIYRKLDELIELLSKSDIDSETAKAYQKKLDKALQRQIQKKLVTNTAATRPAPEPINTTEDNTEIFLSSTQFESKAVEEKVAETSGLNKYGLWIVSGVAFVIGFTMFMLPNLRIFNRLNSGGDGVNPLSVLALLFTLIGACFLIVAIYRKPKN